MKIKALRIKNFKGFSSEIEVNFKGKNLVIYGENGSGKTSIMEAFKLMFDSASQKIEIDTFKNIFTKGKLGISIETTDGKNIALKTLTEKRKDEVGNEKEALTTYPENYTDQEKTFLEALSRSTSILSYRELMKIYDLKTDEDFYDLFVKKIMAYYLIPPKREKTLIQELEELEKLKKESPRATRRIKGKEKSIRDEINKIFSEIRDKWNEYVKKLTDDDIEIECVVEELNKLNFQIKWNGKNVRNILTYINEGRLNAISLSLFLSYYKKFNVSPYKLLLLDDVVVGLDMNLRIPLLNILQQDFEEQYQIIITTFDENWFNLMKNYLDRSKWEFLRLVVKNAKSTKLPFIVGVEVSDYLAKAEEYMGNSDVPAAALYARLEFERLLKKFAEKKKIKIKYKTRQIEDIWTEAKEILNGAKELIRKVEFYRSILLNPSVHYDPRPKYQREVKTTIDVVKKLKEEIEKKLE